MDGVVVCADLRGSSKIGGSFQSGLYQPCYKSSSIEDQMMLDISRMSMCNLGFSGLASSISRTGINH